jgi:hypothetical protein
VLPRSGRERWPRRSTDLPVVVAPGNIGYPGIAEGCSTPLRVGMLAVRSRPVSQWYHGGMALTLRTDEELEQALAALAESEGLSRQEVIRRAVLERYERAGHASRVAESADRMLERWGDVIDRLGSV